LTRSGESLAQLLNEEGIHNHKVLKAIATTPREIFLPDALRHKAYQNTFLPIGRGQTLSQPYTVAKMTELLVEHQHPINNVLEIGTGSGYQTAILAQLFPNVYSVERIKELQFQAKRKLRMLDLYNVSTKHGDGWEGWSSKGPFDAIIVTAAASSQPQALLEQLKDLGRLVVPIGIDEQTLQCIDYIDGEYTATSVEQVKFVPLVPGATQ
jgi:protein-L-isoaspartate(D-aspartate) O-methyltransferase